MKKTIGILAHVDAGKTTLSEQLLYHTNSIKHKGRVDHKDAFLDSHDIEKQRGITVFADQGLFTFNDSTYYLIDTPGHVDFSPEMERSLQVMDYAVVIVSSVEGVEGHTETLWHLLRKYQIPTFFFINKIDREGADLERVHSDIRDNFSKNLLIFEGRELEKEQIESIAELDEELLEYYFERGYEKQRWLVTIQKLIKQQKLFPCYHGSALQDIGVENFLESLDTLTTTDYRVEEPFSAQVYKIRHDSNGTRLTFIKVLSGKIKVRDQLSYGNRDNLLHEKVTQMRVYNGKNYQTVDEVVAGEHVALIGLTATTIGDTFGHAARKSINEIVPTLKSKVLFEPHVNLKEAIRFFKILEAEDPSLNVIWESNLQEIHIHIMGAIQLEVLQELVWDRFQLKVKFEQPEILYKETISSGVIGCGHFEPLGHYAEVHLKLEPGEKNSGITFHNACHADDLSIGNQNLIRHHLFEREHHGILTGSPVTDLKVTLLTGKAHNKHTSGGDFREATFRALRQGLEKTKNILLEPVYQFKIKVELDVMGRVLADIQTAHGRFDAPITEGAKAIITGTVPVATFMNYYSKLASITSGRGSITLLFAGYEPCHNQNEIISKIGYNKDADSEYTSSSIFCSKGQGFSVTWSEAEAYMHCLTENN